MPDLKGIRVLAVDEERGLVVAVTSNISYADTFAVAAKLADAFAAQATAAARPDGRAR